MPRFLRGLFATLSSLVVLGASSLPAQAAEPVVHVPDPAFRTCLRNELTTRELPSALTAANLALLDGVSCWESHGTVRDVTGAEALTAARLVSLKKAAVRDLGPILDLPLRTLELHYADETPVDLADLAALPPMTTLFFDIPGLRDFSFLEGRTEIETLMLLGHPDADLTPVAALPGLRGAALRVGSATDLAPLAQLKAPTLDLELADPVTVPATLHPQTSTLNLSGPGLTGLDWVNPAPAIRKLDLEDGDLASLTGVTKFPSLRSLSIVGSSLAPLTPLRGLAELQVLHIEESTDVELSGIGAPPALTGLSVIGSGLSSLAGLPAIPTLTRLDLGSNHIRTLAGLGGLPLVSTLDVASNELSGTGGLEMATLPALRELNISRNRLTALPSTNLTKGLATLHAYDNQLRTLGPANSLSQLQTLDAGRNQLTAIDALKGAQLTKVGLSDNQISSVAPLSSVAARASVDLSRNRISDLSPLPDSVRPSASQQRISYPAATVGKPFDLKIRTVTGVALCPDFLRPATCKGGKVTYPVSGTYTGYWGDEPVTSSITQKAGPNRKFTLVNRPHLSTTKAVVGRTLVTLISFPTWKPYSSGVYTWRRDGVRIPGIISENYKVTAADLGHRLQGCLTAEADGFDSTTVCTKSSKVTVKGTLTSPARPKLTGTAKVGKVLTAKPGTWTKGTTLSYQWQRNGTSIAGATSKTYTVKKSDKGDQIRVRVTGKKAGYTTKKTWSVSVRPKA